MPSSTSRDLYGQLFTGDGWGERLELFQLWTGGMSFHGGFLGVVIGLTIYGSPGSTGSTCSAWAI